MDEQQEEEVKHVECYVKPHDDFDEVWRFTLRGIGTKSLSLMRVSGISWKPYQNFEEVSASAPVLMERGEVQALFDRLWKIGFRPSEVVRRNEESALEAHLRDMQKIAFLTLGVVLKE